MGYIQPDYEGRLPYCWAWDPETRTEYLLNRGYNAIASRPADDPLAATLLQGTRHPDHAFNASFYDDGNSPPARQTDPRPLRARLCSLHAGLRRPPRCDETVERDEPRERDGQGEPSQDRGALREPHSQRALRPGRRGTHPGEDQRREHPSAAVEGP